jgi:hypothetical protein
MPPVVGLSHGPFSVGSKAYIAPGLATDELYVKLIVIGNQDSSVGG